LSFYRRSIAVGLCPYVHQIQCQHLDQKMKRGKAEGSAPVADGSAMQPGGSSESFNAVSVACRERGG
jgi:hypothetical protein